MSSLCSTRCNVGNIHKHNIQVLPAVPVSPSGLWILAWLLNRLKDFTNLSEEMLERSLECANDGEDTARFAGWRRFGSLALYDFVAVVQKGILCQNNILSDRASKAQRITQAAAGIYTTLHAASKVKDSMAKALSVRLDRAYMKTIELDFARIARSSD